MRRPMEGIRVLEVAQFTFVPAAGGVLADWGADVIKVEHAEHGDAQRGLSRLMGMPVGDSFAPLMEHPNRGKRSIGLALEKPGARAVLGELIRTSDVFLTNFLPSARARLGIELDDVRKINPGIIYVRGSGFGSQGPEADRGGYTADDRWLVLAMLQPGRYWPEFCRAIEREDLITDDRFGDTERLMENAAAAAAIIADVIAARTLAEWTARFAGMEGQWAIAQDAWEVGQDPALRANGLIAEITDADGIRRELVANPVQFDEAPASITRAPQFAEHTDEILAELGLSDEKLIDLKLAGAVT